MVVLFGIAVLIPMLFQWPILLKDVMGCGDFGPTSFEPYQTSRGTTGHFLVHNLPKTTAGFLDKLDNWGDLSFFTPIDSAQTYPTMVIESSNYRGVIQAPAAALDNSKICFEASDGSPLPKALGWISSRREPMSFMSLSPGFILRSGYVVVKSL